MRKTTTSDEDVKIAMPAATDEHSIWLCVGTLLDGCSTNPLKNTHVVYNASSIRYVGGFKDTPPEKHLKPSQKQPDLYLPDFTLLPGLIEAHAHLFLDGSELDFEKRKAYLRQSPQDLLRAAHQRLQRLLRIGIIAVRDAGDKHGVGLSLSKLSRSSDQPSLPYVDSPGAAIHHRGCYGGFMAEPIEDFTTSKACVASRVRAGADRIKLIATDIIDFSAGKVNKPPQMSAQEIAELVRAARKFDKQTFAHASGDDGIANTLAGGVDSVEHGFFIRKDQLAQMRDRHIAWTPTFAPVQRQVDYAEQMGWDEKTVSNLRRILDQHASSLRHAHELGVPILCGSDAGSYGVEHGNGLLYEMELMVGAGLSPLSVTNAATGTSSKRLGFKEKFGQIKSGYKSRFILTQHSPLESIANLRRKKFVVFDGAVYDSDEDKSFMSSRALILP